MREQAIQPDVVTLRRPYIHPAGLSTTAGLARDPSRQGLAERPSNQGYKLSRRASKAADHSSARNSSTVAWASSGKTCSTTPTSRSL